MARIFKIIINKNLLEILNTLFIITIFKQTFISLVVFNSHKHYTILLTLHCQSLFKYFYIYIYISFHQNQNQKRKEIQKQFNRSSNRKPRIRRRDRFLVWGRKKKKKIPKIGKKKKKLKANHLSLALTKPRDTVRVRVKIVGQGTERIGASIPLYPPLNGRYSEEAGSIWEPRRCSWHLAGIQLNIDPAPFSAGKQLCTLINAPPLSAQSNRIVLERTESNPTIPPPRWIIDPAGIYGAALPSPSPLLFNTRRVHTRGGCAYGGSSARSSSIGRS